MPRIQFRIYVNPGQAEVFCLVERNDYLAERLTGVVDTGAMVTLLPQDLLPYINHTPTQRGRFRVEQAGIAKQSFEALEAVVQMRLEDEYGNSTQPFLITVWFANTDKVLIGWKDILDRATMFLDMRHNREGWLEFDD